MDDERPCLIDAHVAVASYIAGNPVVIELCSSPATHVAIVRLEPIGGLVIQFDTDVCDEHDRYLAASGFYVRSLKLRSRPGSATTSPAAES